MELSLKALALALGLTWGGGVLLLGLMAAVGWGGPAVEVIGSVYRGYGPGLVGALIGGAWGLVDGAVGGLLIAWLYNRLR